METIQAKMFVRSLSNSAAKVLVSFILARTALDVKELHEWTGLKRETIYSGLELLRSCGLLEPQTVDHGRQVWVPAGDVLPGILQMSEKRTPELPQESEKWTPDVQMSEKRTPDLLVVGGGDSELKKLNTPPPTTSSQMSTKRTPGEVERLLQYTHLLFDGSFVNSKGLEDREPDEVLGWCAYGYDQFRQGRADRPAGLVRRKLLDQEPAPDALREGWVRILPENYLEAVGMIEYECEFCKAPFGKREALQEHQRAVHPYVCEECRPSQAFQTQTEWQAHYHELHDPYRAKAVRTEDTEEIPSLELSEGWTAAEAWQAVQVRLQQEMPRASFDTWVRDTKALRYDGNSLTVTARNAYAADWLKSRVHERAGELLREVTRTDAQVTFAVGESA